MVEAIEDLFIPVLIYNNKEHHADLLKSFQEPSWNNPVTRFLDEQGKDLIPRKDGIWKTHQMASRMIAALKAANRPVPAYLQGLTFDDNSATTATFAMHCYWEGEGKLGAIPGVWNTHSAWLDGLEVVEVKYDSSHTDYETLIEAAQSMECASKVFAHSESQFIKAKKAVGRRAVRTNDNAKSAKPSDQKYYLRNTPRLRALPLTKYQTTKINAAIHKGSRDEIDAQLSPRQRQLLAQLVALQSDTALKDLVFPEDDTKLPEYAFKLRERIHQQTKSETR